jgi:chromosome segregation ATPase
LDGRAREWYDCLDRLSSERNWYRDQYDALDALVEALRTDNRWLEYRVETIRDELLEQDARAAEDASVVAKVRMALLERDEVLRKAREDTAAVRVAAAEFERELASARATLEGARSWQSQAEEKAKEVEELRTSMSEKVAFLASTEGQLQQERDARQQAEAQFQQERITLAEARAALERKRLAREEAQGLLEQERAALEEAQETLK